MAANSNINNSNSFVCNLINSTTLEDPIWIYNPLEQELPTCKKGKNRIDIILVSSGLLQCIKTIKHLPFDEITVSDHRDICIDFVKDLLFGNNLKGEMKKNIKNIKFKNPKKD